MRLLLQPVSSKVKKGTRTVRASVVALFLGKSEEVVSLLGKEFPELGLLKENCIELSWIDSVLWWELQSSGLSWCRRSWRPTMVAIIMVTPQLL
ncbi:Berberine bridge enzyme-like 21, partial [Cucurbita argyrosperma subsp. argyrosperma]